MVAALMAVSTNVLADQTTLLEYVESTNKFEITVEPYTTKTNCSKPLNWLSFQSYTKSGMVESHIYSDDKNLDNIKKVLTYYHTTKRVFNAVAQTQPNTGYDKLFSDGNGTLYYTCTPVGIMVFNSGIDKEIVDKLSLSNVELKDSGAIVFKF